MEVSKDEDDCLDDVVKAVNESGSPNIPQLVGTQAGEVIVPVFNWSDYFEDKTIKTALKGISHVHHFHFKYSAPGTLLVKDTIDDKEWRVNQSSEGIITATFLW